MTWVSSSLIVGATFLLTQALRVISRSVLPHNAYQYLAESLCVFQLTSCVLENGIMLANYGTWVYASLLFCLGVGYSLTFDAYGNPAGMFEQILKKKIGVLNGALKMIFEVAGGLLAYHYMFYVWKTFAPSTSHINRVKIMRTSCESALKVDLFTGLVVEALAMFISRSVAGMGFGGPKYYKMVNAFTSAIVVISGLEWTGMMFNPALATALTYNCRGHQLHEHIIVYWIGPFIGTSCCILVFNFILDEYEHGSVSVNNGTNGIKKDKKS